MRLQRPNSFSWKVRYWFLLTDWLNGSEANWNVVLVINNNNKSIFWTITGSNTRLIFIETLLIVYQIVHDFPHIHTMAFRPALLLHVILAFNFHNIVIFCERNTVETRLFVGLFDGFLKIMSFASGLLQRNVIIYQ